MTVLSRIFTVLVLGLTLLPTVVHCFCRVEVEPEDCHASAEMPDCCCNREVEVTQEASGPDPALLPSDLKMPQLQLYSVVEAVDPTLSAPFYSLGAGELRITSLRSPPALYLLHASFLI